MSEPQTEGHAKWCDCSVCVPKRDAESLPPERRFGTDEKDIDFGSEMHQREAAQSQPRPQPTREARVDLAEVLHAVANDLRFNRGTGWTRNEWSSAVNAVESAASALRASAHPEQSARVHLSPEDRDRADRLIANTQDGAELIPRILAALEPASIASTPEQSARVDRWDVERLRDLIAELEKVGPEVGVGFFSEDAEALGRVLDALGRGRPTADRAEHDGEEQQDGHDSGQNDMDIAE